MDEFANYLKGKKINPPDFELNEPERFKEFKMVFDQIHPNSFTAQKLFLINQIRRRYPYIEE